MICYKGFNKDMTCTQGRGRFQYKVGETFTAEKAKCAMEGLHCVEEPIRVYDWYRDSDSRYCMVEAKGDINEINDKICCTEMTILKELTFAQIAALECVWIQNHPDRVTSEFVSRESWVAGPNEVIIVRGKHPKAAGGLGATCFLLREAAKSNEIVEMGCFKVDDKEYKQNVYYTVSLKKSREAKKKEGQGCEKKNSGS